MYVDFIYQAVITYGLQLLIALFALVAGLAVIKLFTNAVSKKFEKAAFDPSLQPFLLSLIRISLQVLLVISVASMLGLAMTSFIAVLGAVAFAVGLSLQGSLSNFAGGVLILLLRPFKVGDYIEAAGQAGTVKEIQIFYTLLNTPDNKRIIVPNGLLSNSSMINYSTNTTRRLDFTFGVGYDDDIEKVKSVLMEIAENHPLVFKDPAPQVILGEHGDSAVIFYFRMWCERDNYWTIYFEMFEKVKIAFDQAGINIPYPQMDVHLPGSSRSGSSSSGQG